MSNTMFSLIFNIIWDLSKWIVGILLSIAVVWFSNFLWLFPVILCLGSVCAVMFLVWRYRHWKQEFKDLKKIKRKLLIRISSLFDEHLKFRSEAMVANSVVTRRLKDAVTVPRLQYGRETAKQILETINVNEEIKELLQRKPIRPIRRQCEQLLKTIEKDFDLLHKLNTSSLNEFVSNFFPILEHHLLHSNDHQNLVVLRRIKKVEKQWKELTDRFVELNPRDGDDNFENMKQWTNAWDTVANEKQCPEVKCKIYVFGNTDNSACLHDLDVETKNLLLNVLKPALNKLLDEIMD